MWYNVFDLLKTTVVNPSASINFQLLIDDTDTLVSDPLKVVHDKIVVELMEAFPCSAKLKV